MVAAKCGNTFTSPPSAIVVQNLNYHYDGALAPALVDLSVEVEQTTCTPCSSAPTPLVSGRYCACYGVSIS